MFYGVGGLLFTGDIRDRFRSHRAQEMDLHYRSSLHCAHDNCFWRSNGCQNVVHCRISVRLLFIFRQSSCEHHDFRIRRETVRWTSQWKLQRYLPDCIHDRTLCHGVGDRSHRPFFHSLVDHGSRPVGGDPHHVAGESRKQGRLSQPTYSGGLRYYVRLYNNASPNSRYPGKNLMPQEISGGYCVKRIYSCLGSLKE